MIIAVLADIHSNLQALEAVLSDAREQGAQQFIVAGDHVIDGPAPTEVLQRVMDLTPNIIQGNREVYLLEHRAGLGPSWANRHQTATLQWSYERMGPQQWACLEAMPAQLSLQFEGVSLRVVHGSPWRVNGKLEEEADIQRAVAEVQEEVIIHGHSHLPRVLQAGGKLFLNPGSVGVHFDTADDRTKYALLHIANGQARAELRSVAYDTQALWRNIRDSGLLAAAPHWTMLSFVGNRDGQNYCLQFLADATKERRRRDLLDEGFFSNEIWEAVWDRWTQRLPQLRF